MASDRRQRERERDRQPDRQTESMHGTFEPPQNARKPVMKTVFFDVFVVSSHRDCDRVATARGHEDSDIN